MRITIEATGLLTELDGVECRLWEGVTDQGTPCKVFVHRVAVHEDQDASAFDVELAEKLPPGRPATLAEAFALRGELHAGSGDGDGGDHSCYAAPRGAQIGDCDGDGHYLCKSCWHGHGPEGGAA